MRNTYHEIVNTSGRSTDRIRLEQAGEYAIWISYGTRVWGDPHVVLSIFWYRQCPPDLGHSDTLCGVHYIEGREGGGPEIVSYHHNGVVEGAFWHLEGDLHREDEPALILYSPAGEVREAGWYQHGRLTRNVKSP